MNSAGSTYIEAPKEWGAAKILFLIDVPPWWGEGAILQLLKMMEDVLVKRMRWSVGDMHTLTWKTCMPAALIARVA